ncbi:MAG TPA: hypothetical protein VMW17_06120 [Candidatus Binatia bacterium]|nr:hypothetical protein [Candidatus Binatia bacterium]
MKVAISVPDGVFDEAERIVKRLRVSRSQVYSQALEEFTKKHRGQRVRELLDAVYSSGHSRRRSRRIGQGWNWLSRSARSSS